MALLNNTTARGFLMVDVLIGLAVAVLLSAAFTGGVVRAARASSDHARAVQADILALDALEVARELEKTDAGWIELRKNVCMVACHPVASTEWTLANGSETILGFSRAVRVESVRRSGASFPNVISPSGSFVDPNSKRVTVTVQWNSYGETREHSLVTYVYDR